MEAKENNSSKNIFEKMYIPTNPSDSSQEIQLFSTQSKQTCRHPYVFCKICGKFGRKDFLKHRHFPVHPYIPISRLGFVKQNEEPNRDKYGHFEKFLENYGPQEHHQEVISELKKINDQDQIECQRFYWGNRGITHPSEDLQGTKTPKNEEINSQRKQKGKNKNKNSSDLGTKSVPRSTALRGANKNQNSLDQNQGKNLGTDQNKCGEVGTDMCNQKLIKSSGKRVKVIKQINMKLKKLKTKSVKTRRANLDKNSKNSTRKEKILNTISLVKQSSKRIKKKKQLKTFKAKKSISKLKIGKDKDDISIDTDQFVSLTKWKEIIQQLNTRKREQDLQAVSNFWRSKYVKATDENTKEVLDLNEQHKQLMLRERDKHCHLYNQSAKFESNQQRLHDQMICTRDQREEINILLTRLAKYAPREVSDYPKAMITNGSLDPHVWKLTRKATTDEKRINDLESKLDTKDKQLQQALKENQDFKSQIFYASNHIKLISQSSGLVIENLMAYQQAKIVINCQNHQQSQDPRDGQIPQQPQPQQAEQVIEYYCNEQVEEVQEETSIISSERTSQKKSVSFSPKEVVIGNKIIDSKNPKTCQDYYDSIKQRKQNYKRRQFEKIRSLYPSKIGENPSADSKDPGDGLSGATQMKSDSVKSQVFMTPDSKLTLGQEYKGNFF